MAGLYGLHQALIELRRFGTDVARNAILFSNCVGIARPRNASFTDVFGIAAEPVLLRFSEEIVVSCIVVRIVSLR